MTNFRPILEILGILLTGLALLMLAPLAVDIATGHKEWYGFAMAAFFTAFTGVTLWLVNHDERKPLAAKQAFVLIAAIWLVIPAFAALPFMLRMPHMSYTNAFFEAISGFASCGATIITDLDVLPPGVLLWRALLNWVGGLTVIIMAITLLPMLKIGGMQLFKLETHDKHEKIFSRTIQLAITTLSIYLFFTVFCAFSLWMVGVNLFDAICHAMSAIAAGGIGNHDTSIAYFNNVAVEIILMLTMIASCLPFALYIQASQGHCKPLWRDSQVRCFLSILLFSIITVALWLQAKAGMEFWEGIRYASFNVTSAFTTAGFFSADYTTWGSYPLCLLLLLSFIGGCAGSTAGAIKIFRIQILYQAVKVQVKQLIHPHGVFKAQFNGKPVKDSVLSTVFSFFFVYMALFALLAVILAAQGLDFLTSISAVASAMAAAGYGLGDIIGPMGSYQSLPDMSKWVLSAAMIMGRLEFFTILVLFSPNFWRS